MTDEEADELALAQTTLALAEDIFRAELLSADTIDLKSVGLATADVAALTILVTFHASVWKWAWGPSAVLLSLSALSFFVVLRQRRWRLGVDPKKYWEANTGRGRLEGVESAIATTEKNRRHNEPYLESKGDWFLRGYVLLAAGLIVLILATLWHAR